MTTPKKILFIQIIIITFLWLMLLLIPLIFESDTDREWSEISRIWMRYGWIFALFIINRFVLMPYLFFRHRHVTYFIAIGGLVLVLFLGMYLDWESKQAAIPPRLRAKSEQLRPANMPQSQTLNQPRPLSRRATQPIRAPFANILILSILIVGFDTALNISMRWMGSEQKRAKLEAENTNVKLALLRNQISPHFFMNTLNNIHALVDIDQQRSKDSIIRLSKLMSYLLYETNERKVPLTNEFEFIRNYVDLMRLRYSDKVEIEMLIEDDIPNIEVPPLLFLNFIENAFKHGVSYQDGSFIKMRFKSLKNSVEFDILNTNHSNATKESQRQSQRQGLGIANSRHRLDLLYGKKYRLRLEDMNKLYHVNLVIPV